MLDIFKNFNRNNFQKQEFLENFNFGAMTTRPMSTQYLKFQTDELQKYRLSKDWGKLTFVHWCRFAITTKKIADKDTAGLEFDSANQAECLRSRYNPITLLWFLHINQTKSNLSHLLILIEIIFNSKNYS